VMGSNLCNFQLIILKRNVIIYLGLLQNNAVQQMKQTLGLQQKLELG